MGALYMGSITKNRGKQLKNRAELLENFQIIYGVCRPLQAVCLRAPMVTDRPLHYAGDPVRGFVPGNLSVLPPGRVLTTPVLKAGVHPIPNRLHQPPTEGHGHHSARQPLGLPAGDLFEKEVHLDHLLSRLFFHARARVRRAASAVG